jgi:hypothetical protein
MSVEYLDRAYRLINRPLWFHRAGLSQTRSGYGSKLTSSRVAVFTDDRGRTVKRRVYITQFSNSGTAWINYQGRSFVVLREDLCEP